MGQYIHFTEEQKFLAGSVDLEEFLRLRGERLLASGREKRLAGDQPSGAANGLTTLRERAEARSLSCRPISASAARRP